jgi:alkanesulfonate monooxygenase SsuD/methylene tetrahydromethanopterin reductase-like flavin-dependent oxidoreductase (luciferase family)
MRYGLNLPNGGPCGDARTLGELAALAEAAGWDGVFLEDYLVYQGQPGTPTYDPWVALAAMALRTERIRLGTEVTPLTRRRPWKLARETVTLDHLSGGRLILGVGLGDGAELSFTHFGEATDARQRAQMLDEGLEVLVGLWSGRPFQYHGAHHRVEEVTFLPRPVQTPRIPIWVGGGYPLPGPMQRAARWDGACLYRHPPGPSSPDMTPADVRALIAFVEGRRPAPAAPFEVVVGGRERREDWGHERALIGALAEAGATWWIEWVPPADLATMRQAIAHGPLRVEGG